MNEAKKNGSSQPGEEEGESRVFLESSRASEEGLD